MNASCFYILFVFPRYLFDTFSKGRYWAFYLALKGMNLYCTLLYTDAEGSDVVHRTLHLRDLIGWSTGACGHPYHSVQYAQDESEWNLMCLSYCMYPLCTKPHTFLISALPDNSLIFWDVHSVLCEMSSKSFRCYVFLYFTFKGSALTFRVWGLCLGRWFPSKICQWCIHKQNTVTKFMFSL